MEKGKKEGQKELLGQVQEKGKIKRTRQDPKNRAHPRTRKAEQKRGNPKREETNKGQR